MNNQERKQFYKDHPGKRISTEEYEYENTKGLQLRSLCAFARSLGYYEAIGSMSFVFDGYPDEITFKGCETISFSTMTKLHNSQWRILEERNIVIPEQLCTTIRKMSGIIYQCAFTTDAYTLTKAHAAKIVDKVYLHETKTGISCYKHQVKYMNPLFEGLFAMEDAQ